MGRGAEPIPIPSPHNLKIQSGDVSEEDIIKDTKKGILVGRLWYTYAVNPIKGDFSCTARSGIRIIQDGEIKKPGKSVRIVHNISTMLQNISAVGNNIRNVLQWASLPSICPSLKVEEIKIVAI
jgi:PmbA protein